MKKTICLMGTNLKMSNGVYALRSQVMAHVYEAKHFLQSNGIEIPRVNVRITDNTGKKGVLGMASLEDKIIWIGEDTLSKYPLQLREVVYHELVHTLTGFKHDENCRLMKSCVDPKQAVLSKEEADELLLKYFVK